MTIFTGPNCPYCEMAKRFLSQRGVQFRERDVSRDRQAAEEMIRRSGQQGVPVIVAGREVIVGFDRGRLESLLSRAAPPRSGLGAAVAGAESIARRRGVALPPGAYVGRVRAGTPAETAGLRGGDVILSLGGTAVRDASALEQVLAALPRRVPVDIVWWREGRTLQGHVRLD